jgi:hypothetical protein
MVYGYRRSYSYDEQRIWDLLFEAGLTHKAFKLNPRAFERLMDRGNLDPDLKALLAETRTTMQETKTITFVKPSPPVADEPSSNGKAPAEAVDAESLAEVDTEDVPAV